MTPTVRAGDQPDAGAARWAPGVAWTLTGLYAVAIALALPFQAQAHASHAPAEIGTLEWMATPALDALTFSAFVLAGAVIVSRRPRNTIGWLMVVAGLARGVRLLAGSYAMIAIGSSPTDPGIVGLSAAWVFALLQSVGFSLAVWFLPLLYPDGSLPSRRWRPVLWIMIAFTALGAIGQVAAERLIGQALAFGAGVVVVYDIANPLAVEAVQPLTSVVTTAGGAAGGLVFAALLVAAIVAVVVRFRRSSGIGRQQMKWFAFAISLTLSLFLFDLLLRAAGAPEPVFLLADGLVLASLTLHPVAIGIAVLRYRLYEIDRIISRTVSYGLVIAILAAVYAGAVVGLGAAVSAATGGEDSDLVVAASTLLAAGLFRPVRTRVQSVVDRRFNRTGYEARQAVETFARAVRDEVDRDRLSRRTAETAATAVEPTHVSLWLHDDRDGSDS